MPTDQFLDELTSDQLGPADATSEPAEPTPEEPAESEPAGGGEPAPAQGAVPEPVITYGGKQYTESQLRALPFDKLQAIVTSAEQLPNLTKKHQQTLEQLAAKALEAQPPAQPAQPAPGEPRRLTTHQLRAQYEPMISEAVKDGHLEEDFNTLYPGTAASLMFFRDVIENLAQSNAQVWNAINTVQTNITGREEMTAREQALRGLDNTMAGLAGEGELFAPLADQAARNALFEYGKSLNLQYGTFKNPETLKALWIAMNRDKVLGSAPAPAPAPRVPRAPATARGVGGTTRPTAPPITEMTALDELINDALPRR